MLDLGNPSSPVPKIQAGSGRIVLGAQGHTVAFSELSSAYPLKLLAPRIVQDTVAVVYVLTYGGGLVGGDQLKLCADVDDEATLVVLSQGSTKVFKTRPGRRLADVSRLARGPHVASPSFDITSQVSTFNVASGSTLALLMEPVACFRSAKYSQVQTFHLKDDRSSIIVLDWITSGRKALGEEWAFSRYYSCNEIYIGKKRVIRDIMLLEDDAEEQKKYGLPSRSLVERLVPYACYATVFFYGPKTQITISRLLKDYETISVPKTTDPEDLLWSLSPVTSKNGKGAVLRVAALETEMVKKWLLNALGGLQDVIGVDALQRAFA
ncbi:hypothetical protein AX15_000851 [Amanita polypyramis BW_CC]|nr:hypothetical protein AX15_000851 [Amanita polypyramis BW_CC]